MADDLDLPPLILINTGGPANSPFTACHASPRPPSVVCLYGDLMLKVNNKGHGSNNRGGSTKKLKSHIPRGYRELGYLLSPRQPM